MEDKYTKEKLKIIENVLTVNDKKLLLQLQYLISNFSSENEITNIQSIKEETISFEEETVEALASGDNSFNFDALDSGAEETS